jgi:hypothetical protein
MIYEKADTAISDAAIQGMSARATVSSICLRIAGSYRIEGQSGLSRSARSSVGWTEHAFAVALSH